MNRDDEQHQMDDAMLDAMLAQAHWPAPGADREQRLRGFWLSMPRDSAAQNRAGRYRAWRYWAVAAGVGLLLGVWAAWELLPRHRAIEPRTTVRHDSAPLHDQKLNAPPARPSFAANRPARIFVRSPNALEMAMLISADRASLRVPGRLKTPEARVARAVAALSGMNQGWLESGIRSALRPDSRRYVLAARMLAATATVDQLPMLLRLDRNPLSREAAVASLTRVAPPELLASLLPSHADPAQRRQLLAGMLRGNLSRAAPVYLQCVRDPRTTETALAVLNDAPISADVFFPYLNDPHDDIRLAATKVLGRIDGPRTTAILATMAEQNHNRREALMALAESSGPEAREFLALAQASGPMAGAARSIMLEHHHK
jgi:hypothetical protein